MENIIAKLLQDFEQGKMSRRQLIQSIAITATAASVASVASAAPTEGDSVFKVTTFNHTSYHVHDYRKTRDWYSKMFGMTVAEQAADKDGEPEAGMCRLTFGNNMIVVRSGKKVGPTPLIDHVGFIVDQWDYEKMSAELMRRDIPIAGPRVNKQSLHVLDPDGFLVQFGGDKQY
jgi:catechol 2,3-dioxygenase-like lactoylglutathione lyase family enzyme